MKNCICFDYLSFAPPPKCLPYSLKYFHLNIREAHLHAYMFELKNENITVCHKISNFAHQYKHFNSYKIYMWSNDVLPIVWVDTERLEIQGIWSSLIQTAGLYNFGKVQKVFNKCKLSSLSVVHFHTLMSIFVFSVMMLIIRLATMQRWWSFVTYFSSYYWFDYDANVVDNAPLSCMYVGGLDGMDHQVGWGIGHLVVLIMMPMVMLLMVIHWWQWWCWRWWCWYNKQLPRWAASRWWRHPWENTIRPPNIFYLHPHYDACSYR